MSRTIAVADVGGTHSRFGLAEIGDGRVLALGEPITLNTAGYAGFLDAWREFARMGGPELPDALAIAFAGPVGGDVLELTNSKWVIRPSSLKDEIGVGQCRIVNDLGAIGHAVARLSQSDFVHLCGPEGEMPEQGATTVIGPGTGLGVAQLLRTPAGYRVVETEGGHIDFAPLDAFEDQLLVDLRQRFGRVSVERVASGSGIENLYRRLAEIDGQGARSMDDKAIWSAALDGSDPLAVAALDRFFLSLGAVAGDLALAHGSKAVVVAGGLGYRLKGRFAGSGFAGRFIAKGRFQGWMEAIPVKLLNYPQPGLYGAAAAFAQEFA